MKTISIVVLGLLLFAGCRESKECEEEIYLIPEGFRGKIIVFFDQKDGQVKQYENTARLYRIPSSGIIKSQFPKNGGCMGDGRIQFYYEDSLGTRKTLDYFLDIDRGNLPTDSDYVLFTFLSEKNRKPDFVIHFVGHLGEFNDLTQSVMHLDPVAVLDSI